MAGYYPLPQFNPGGGINFEPLERAIGNYAQTRHRNALMVAQEDERARDNAFRERQFGLQEQQFGLTKRNSDFDYQAKKDSLPLEQQLREAQLAQTRAQTTQLGQKNQLESAIAGMIASSMGSGSEAPPPHSTPGSSNNLPSGGTIQPQSYQGGSGVTTNALMQDANYQSAPAQLQQRNALMPEPPPPATPSQYRPGVILAADNMPNSGQTSSPPLQAPPQSSDPMAGMSSRRRAAFALGLAGKGDAGKVLLDMENESRLDKAAQTEVDKQEITTTNSLAKIGEIASSFDPEFLTYQGQGTNWARSVVDKLGYLKPEDQGKLYKFATFRRDAAAAVNAAIKANSGATVTEQELARNLVELPNAGTGLLDGDSPTEFKAKLDRARETLTLGVARSRYLRQKGFTGKPWDSGIELDQMRGMINQRAQQLMGELQKQNPGATPAAIEAEASRRIKQEFGV